MKVSRRRTDESRRTESRRTRVRKQERTSREEARGKFEDVREKAVSDCLSDEDAKSICVTCDTCCVAGKPVRYRHRRALGGRQQDFETVVAPIRDPDSGSIAGLIGSHQVMETASRDAVESDAIRRATAKLGLRLLSLQEGIQQRIASDLHGSTCQHLIAASLNVMRMRRAIADIGGASAICDDIDASIDQALGEIRAFSYLLHPQNLLADGLKITIEQFVNGFSARTSLKTDIEIAPEVDKLSYERQLSVLRVIQEALMNVFRHAKATQVKVAMEAAATHFNLRISDNGCGMAISRASGPKAMSFGVGVPAMRVRLQQMGGALEIRSSSASECRGTTLCAVIPHSLPRKKAEPPERRPGRLGHHKSIGQRQEKPASRAGYRRNIESTEV